MERKTLETLKHNIKEEKEIHQKAGVGYTPLIPALRGQRQAGLCEFKTRPVRATPPDPVSGSSNNKWQKQADQAWHWGS